MEKLVTFNIDLSKFPLLNNYTDEELQYTMKSLLMSWYDKTFNNKIDISELDTKIQQGIEPMIKELFGISKSTQKGKVFENLIENYINNNYPQYNFIRTSDTNHSGDGIITINNIKCIIELKNYSTFVPVSQIDKLKNDMKCKHIRYAIMISISGIQDRRDNIDCEKFIYLGKIYIIVFLSNYFNEQSKLETSILLIEQLINIQNNIINLNIFHSQINNLNIIYDDVLKLKTKYLEMEKTFRSTLDDFYITIRDLESNTKNRIQDVFHSVNQTLKTLNNRVENILSKNENKILRYLYDNIFHKKGLYLDSLEKDIIVIMNSNPIMKIKVLKKSLNIIFIDEDLELKINDCNLLFLERVVLLFIEKAQVLNK